MRFDRLDLNLLVALDVLLTEQSVSKAAERLYLSQSATSSALGRLRDYFGDDLLVLKGRAMELTPRAEDLQIPVRSVLEQIRSTISVAPRFDPSKSDRHITIMATDYATEVLFSKAAAYFAREAPGMVFEIIPHLDNAHEPLERRTIDLLLTLDVSMDTNHPREVLFDDEFVLVAWELNEHVRHEITREKFLELGHLATHFGRTRMLSFPDWILQNELPGRRVEIYASTFLTIPSMIVGTDRIAVMPKRIAERAAEHMPIKLMRPPIVIPKVNMVAVWHEANSHDKAIRWTASCLSGLGLRRDLLTSAHASESASSNNDLARQYHRLAANVSRH